MRKTRKNAEEPTPTTDEETTEGEKQKVVSLPYVKGLSEDIERACKQLDMRMVFRSGKTMRSLLTRVKNAVPSEKVKGVIYKVDCTCGSSYIGETNKTLEVRLKEHERAVETDNRKKNGIAVYANNTWHSIDWAKAEIIDKEQNWCKRRVKEALYIKEMKAQMNLDQGLTLNNVWCMLPLT